MQTLGAETDGILLSTAHTICKQGSDFDTLFTTVDHAVSAYVLAHPTAGLIDLDLAGGGAGNTFIATLLVHPGSVETPTEELLSNMGFHWVQASDFTTLQSKLNAVLAALDPDASLWAWDVSSAGAGAVWIAVLVTWTPGGPG